MDLTPLLELTYSCSSMAGQQVQVNQLGEDQARANVSRYNTIEFDPVLEVMNNHVPLKIARLFYADWYNGNAPYNNRILGHHRRSSLRFEFHYRKLRDIALVVNPDGTKFVLVRLPMVGNGRGHEWAFRITGDGLNELDMFLGRLLPRPQGKINPDISDEPNVPRAPVEEFALLGLTDASISALPLDELRVTISRVTALMNRFENNPHKQTEFVKLRRVYELLQRRAN